MKTKVLLVLVFAFVLTTPLYADGIDISRSTEEILEGENLIVLGTISDVKVFADRPTEFHIDIEQTVKPKSLHSQTIVAFGCDPNKSYRGTTCPSFEQGQRGLFLIFPSDDGYKMSFDSRVSESRCTAQEFLSTYRGFRAPNFFLTQNGQSDVFFTGKPLDINYVVESRDMIEHSYSVMLGAHKNGVNHFGFSEVVNGTISQCVGFETITASFVPTKMGTYGFSSDYEGGAQSFYGTAIIEYGTTPRQQYDAGIHAQDVWCKENLFLILKNDDTKARYDNYPACTTKDTVEKLIQRDWGFVPPHSKYNKLLEDGKENEN